MSSNGDTSRNRVPQAADKWWVCGLLLLALMLNYMDRQTLSLTITPISEELGLSNTRYGYLEKGFGYAFALGGVLAGLLADRISVRWLYPLVLAGWSLAGIATGYADVIGRAMAPLVARVQPDWVNPQDPSDCAFLGFMVCRVVLGLFEAGQWPCALVTTQRLLSQADRPFGNSVLQSGASLGAIFTPLVIQALVTDAPGSWRAPYVVIGLTGCLWIGPWLWMVRGIDLGPRDASAAAAGPTGQAPLATDVFWTRYAALVLVVIAINLPWHFFRAWLPKMLEEFHHYETRDVRLFTTAYYVATDVGCLLIGLLTRWLTARGRPVHGSRVLAYSICAGLTALSTLAAGESRGPLLLGLLMLIGAGSLGLFPLYYSLTQELSTRHQGKVTGSLSLITWIFTSEMQVLVGRQVDRTHSYADGIFWIGLVPLLGLFGLLALWNVRSRPVPTAE